MKATVQNCDFRRVGESGGDGYETNIRIRDGNFKNTKVPSSFYSVLLLLWTVISFSICRVMSSFYLACIVVYGLEVSLSRFRVESIPVCPCPDSVQNVSSNPDQD